MKAEARELYVFTVDHFEEEIADCFDEGVLEDTIGDILDRAVEKYMNNYASDNDNVFSKLDINIAKEQIIKEMRE